MFSGPSTARSTKCWLPICLANQNVLLPFTALTLALNIQIPCVVYLTTVACICPAANIDSLIINYRFIPAVSTYFDVFTERQSTAIISVSISLGR